MEQEGTALKEIRAPITEPCIVIIGMILITYFVYE